MLLEKELVVADTLSRNPLAVSLQTSGTEDDIKAYVGTAELVRPALHEKLKQIKHYASSDTHSPPTACSGVHCQG